MSGEKDALRWRTLALVLLALVVVLAVALVGTAVGRSRLIGGVWYPVNERGQTYGSARPLNETEGDTSLYPDLILTLTSDGKEGYVERERFFSSEQDIPVYESDGETVVGTYQPSTSSPH